MTSGLNKKNRSAEGKKCLNKKAKYQPHKFPNTQHSWQRCRTHTVGNAVSSLSHFTIFISIQNKMAVHWNCPFSSLLLHRASCRFTKYHTTNKCTNCMSFILNHFFKNKWHTISAFVGCVIISVHFQLVVRQWQSLKTAVMDDSDHLRRWESCSRRFDGASS